MPFYAETSLSETIHAHRQMWLWLYYNPEYTKGDWPGWEFNDGKYAENDEDCFLCIYAKERIKDEESNEPNYCFRCPLEWPAHPDEKIRRYSGRDEDGLAGDVERT